MKYCIYCGLEVSDTDEICPNCYENISKVEINKVLKSNADCIKCHSNNVTCYITKIKRRKNSF